MKKIFVYPVTVLLTFLYACSSGEKAVHKPEVISLENITVSTDSVSNTKPTINVTASPDTKATISGKVKFEGESPRPRPINMSADKMCKAQHKDDIFTEDVVVATDGGMKWILIYLKDGVKQKYPAPSEPAVIEQKGCTYSPHILAVMAGQKVIIKNSDPLLHNIHATPKNNPEFNKGQARQGTSDEIVFEKPEIMLPFKCDVHPWMSAKVNVMEHPFFAITGEDGSFTINNVPAGTYTLAVVSEKFGEKTVQITVKDGGTVTQDFSFSK